MERKQKVKKNTSIALGIALCATLALSLKSPAMSAKGANTAEFQQARSTIIALQKADPSDGDNGEPTGGGSTGGSGGSSGGGGGGGHVSTVPTLAVHTISWNSFSRIIPGGPCSSPSPDVRLCPSAEVVDNPLADGDHVWLTEEDGAQYGVNPGEVEIVFKSAANVQWWKEVKAFNNQAQELGWLQTQDFAHGPASMRVAALSTNLLVFSKGKLLGVHTGMYQVSDLSSKKGKRLTFEWRSD
jgi:hypothetical protein